MKASTRAWSLEKVELWVRCQLQLSQASSFGIEEGSYPRIVPRHLANWQPSALNRIQVRKLWFQIDKLCNSRGKRCIPRPDLAQYFLSSRHGGGVFLVLDCEPRRVRVFGPSLFPVIGDGREDLVMASINVSCLAIQLPIPRSMERLFTHLSGTVLPSDLPARS